ncbi:hypothetical protein AAG570_006132 [Ranatra chinensis]|uniref:Ubiquinol-cytochrome c chaperone domain-containing protein n=1 Tax=Ranatra chinensis TaxID=642074 RepID=A0ABD0XY66_9HEMI
MLTELHVWMLMVRAMADADSGRAVRNSLVEALWQDVAQRVKKLGSEHSSVARQQVLELSEQFQASLVSYDEGLLSGDTVLASALWRRLFAMGYPDPYHLECMVRYIRKSVSTVYLHAMK